MRANGKVLWVLQILLAALFLFAGGAKLMMPAAELTAQSSMPAWFLRFIGVCEIVGAVGLILPWALSMRPTLTPLAAVCLAIIMAGAVITAALEVSLLASVFPLVTGLLLVIVALGRWRDLNAASAGRTPTLAQQM